jgi:hypothetical protein
VIVNWNVPGIMRASFTVFALFLDCDLARSSDIDTSGLLTVTVECT